MLNKSLANYFSLTPFEIHSLEEYAITNPSIIRIESGYQILCRGMLEEENLTTKNICYFFNENFELLNSTVISDDDVRKQFLECQNGLEDGRLFTWKQKIWVIFTGLKNGDSGYVNTMMIGEIFHNRLINVKVLKSPHQMIREKNWMPWVLGDRLFFLYALAPLEIYELVEDSLGCVFTRKGLVRRKSFISGSSQVVAWGDGYLAITHTRHSISVIKKFWMKYLLRDKSYKLEKTYFLHQFVTLNDKFEVTGFSKDFFFEELGIEFCAGVAVSENNLIISYGVRDAQAKFIKLSADKLSTLIKNAD
jgi:hypothetical protein